MGVNTGQVENNSKQCAPQFNWTNQYQEPTRPHPYYLSFSCTYFPLMESCNAEKYAAWKIENMQIL